MMCLFGGSCVTVCESHWGDCNNDYRDGCEVPIKHPYYCDGDPRIKEVSEPTVDFFADDDGVGPGRFDRSAFAWGMDEQIPRLEECYKRILATKPSLHGRMLYQFTLGEDGRIIRTKLVENKIGNTELEGCVAELVRNVHFEHGPKGGSLTYSYRVVFTLGGAASAE